MNKQKIRIEDRDGIGRIFIDDIELQNVTSYQIKREANRVVQINISISATNTEMIFEDTLMKKELPRLGSNSYKSE